ncbi:salicylic acid-binding protein 2-like [Impatiens glandulifera]|uniref:salicylic acid-binding protein 2-like n=1 Tax=Impatiens glandulifera TaxID=253017 RepID=UPI001FB07B46|nr:salicylic acid-binding protein 2-like [Impatiens glandulifera]
MESKHFVLVHGACHGAWCWYKLKPLLESAGHKVTAIDMAASGINPKKIEEVWTFDDYNFIENTPAWLDIKFEPYGPPNENHISILFGPEFLAEKLYHLCPPEDRALALALMKPCSLFEADFANKNLSKEGYGIVPRVYIVCNEDKTITMDFQKWIIENMEGVKQVKAMDNIDHMPMLSGPRDLSIHLLDIVAEYN